MSHLLSAMSVLLDSGKFGLPADTKCAASKYGAVSPYIPKESLSESVKVYQQAEKAHFLTNRTDIDLIAVWCLASAVAITHPREIYVYVKDDAEVRKTFIAISKGFHYAVAGTFGEFSVVYDSVSSYSITVTDNDDVKVRIFVYAIDPETLRSTGPLTKDFTLIVRNAQSIDEEKLESLLKPFRELMVGGHGTAYFVEYVKEVVKEDK